MSERASIRLIPKHGVLLIKVSRQAHGAKLGLKRQRFAHFRTRALETGTSVDRALSEKMTSSVGSGRCMKS